MKIYKKKANSSIRRRMVRYLLYVSLLPLIGLTIISIILQVRTTSSVSTSSMQTEVTLAFSDMNGRFEDAQELCRQIENNALLQRLMRSDYPNAPRKYASELEGNMELASMVLSDDAFSGVYLIGNNGIICKSDSGSLISDSFQDTAWYRKALSSLTANWYSVHNGSYVVRTANDKIITCCYPFRDTHSGENTGVIVVDISAAKLHNLYDGNVVGNGALLILDENNHIFFHSSGTNLREQQLNDAANVVRMHSSELLLQRTILPLTDSNNLYIVARHSFITGWTIAGVVSRSFFFYSATNMLYVIIGIMFLEAALAIVCSGIASRRLSAPIIEIEEAMSAAAQGDLSVHVTPKGEDELASLAAEFNEMVVQINNLMNSNYQSQRRMRKLELKALQEQINPHFLYNSLDSIKWLMRLNRTDDAIAMLKNLSMLYRISLSHGKDFIPIRDELLHVRAYLELQRQEYKSKFTYEIHADEQTFDYLSPKIILQPLVENSLTHGVGDAASEIHVEVIVRQEKDKIAMIVQDDGAGMSAEALKALRKSLADMTEDKSMIPSSESGGYGLKNVSDRIRLYFGPDCGLYIESEEGKGTAVTILIDKRSPDHPLNLD